MKEIQESLNIVKAWELADNKTSAYNLSIKSCIIHLVIPSNLAVPSRPPTSLAVVDLVIGFTRV